MARRSQRDVMRDLWSVHGPDEERVVKAYAQAERDEEATRGSNTYNQTAEEYARRLLYDGLKKGWLDGSAGRRR